MLAAGGAQQLAEAEPFTATESPCQSCGGCCTYSSDWPEFDLEEDLSGIPDAMVAPEGGRMKCDGDRCCALNGEIGVRVSCSIYPHRPNVCREFKPGEASCAQVRRWLRLPALAIPSA